MGPRRVMQRPAVSYAWVLMEMLHTPLSSGGQEQKILLGLTSFITRDPPMLPKLNRRRAQFVLTKIDEILTHQTTSDSPAASIARRGLRTDIVPVPQT